MRLKIPSARLKFSSALTAGLLSAYVLAGCQSSASQGANAPNSAAANVAATTAQPPAAPAASPATTDGAAAPAAAASSAPHAATTTPAGESAHAADAGAGGVAVAPAADKAGDKSADPCALLTSDDIKGVQGEAVSEMKPSRRDDPNFRISQCFYATPTFTKSVSLELTQQGAGDKSVRAFWKENFARAEDKREAKNERRKKSGKPQAGPPARPVKGLGDEAYWVGTNANGTLYAFKKGSLVRISLGGAEEDAARLRKATTLARKALSRL